MQGRRLSRFFDEIGDLPLFIHCHHAKGFRLLAADFDTGHRALASLVNMVSQHQRVIHFVDVISGQNNHEVGAIAVENVMVLRYRVGSTAIPGLLVDALLSGQQINEFIHFAI